jgi:hypothetical protein
MHARFRARRRRRPAIAALGVALVLVLGACDTQPATDITYNAATLNARGACYGTMNGIWQYELRRVGGPWNSVGPLHPFACGASGAETAIQSHRATGLQPNTTYQYRIRAYENNSAREYYFDSTGADRGTNYDQFTTRPYSPSWSFGGVADHSSVPSVEASDASSGGAGGSCRGRYNPLRNHHTFRIYFDGAPLIPIVGDDAYAELYKAESRHAWCWKNGRITWRNSSGESWPVSRYGGVSILGDGWYTSVCAGDMSSCLYRWQTRADIHVTLPISGFPLTVHAQVGSCLGTRVYAGGDPPHNRRTYNEVCSAATTASVARVRSGQMPNLEGIGTPAIRAQLRSACPVGESPTRRCVNVGERLFGKLSKAEQRELVKRTMFLRAEER